MSFSFEFDVKIDEAIEQIAVDGDENICEVQTAGEDVQLAMDMESDECRAKPEYGLRL